MIWTHRLTELRNILAELYPGSDTAVRLVDEAGLPRSGISVKDTPVDTWHGILTEAVRRGRVGALIAVVRAEYEENDRLAQAAESYLEDQYQDWNQRSIGDASLSLGHPLSHSVESATSSATFRESRKSVILRIDYGDILEFEADVACFKYAQHFFGADQGAALALGRVGVATSELKPGPGEFRIKESQGAIQAAQALFVGTEDPATFDYSDVRDFGARTLDILSRVATDAASITMTIHGVGFGLDEREAILAQLAGMMDSINQRLVPAHLTTITILSRDAKQVERLRQTLEPVLRQAKYVERVADSSWGFALRVPRDMSDVRSRPHNVPALQSVGEGSHSKPYAFVVMPSSEEMTDVYHFGVEGPIREYGLLCERIDPSTFLEGLVVERIKASIDSATVVIAEVTGANPNVYLQIGYAWGRSRPTILLARESEDLPLELSGQRYVKYRLIKSLQEALRSELAAL